MRDYKTVLASCLYKITKAFQITESIEFSNSLNSRQKNKPFTNRLFICLKIVWTLHKTVL